MNAHGTFTENIVTFFSHHSFLLFLFSVAECESCPSIAQILGFMFLGMFLVLGMTIFIITSSLKDVGMRIILTQKFLKKNKKKKN